MYNFSPKISKETKFIQRKTAWKLKITLEKYGRNNKENVEKSFKFICESFRRNLNGNQIERIPAQVFKNNSGLAFLYVNNKHLMYY